MVHDRHKTYTTVQNNTILCYQNRYILVIDIPDRSRSVKKMIKMFRVGISQSTFFENHKNSKNNFLLFVNRKNDEKLKFDVC